MITSTAHRTPPRPPPAHRLILLGHTFQAMPPGRAAPRARLFAVRDLPARLLGAALFALLAAAALAPAAAQLYQHLEHSQSEAVQRSAPQGLYAIAPLWCVVPLPTSCLPPFPQ